jgi:hypothetical protein
MKVFIPTSCESLAEFRERVTRIIDEEYRKNVASLMLDLPRTINYSLSDSQSIESFRKTLMLNKFRHHLYNPEFDSVFSKHLYHGLIEEAEKIELNRKYTGSGGSHRSL